MPGAGANSAFSAQRGPAKSHRAVNTTLGLTLSVIFLVAFFFMKNQATRITLTANLMAVEQLKGCIPHLAHNDH